MRLWIKGNWSIKLHDESLGITQQALKALRDELAARINHSIAIFQAPSQDGSHCECFGYLIVDDTNKEVAIVGDGFRADMGGEGGAGARAAYALLSIYGIKEGLLMPEEAVNFTDELKDYEQALNLVCNMAVSLQKPALHPPHYIDHVLHKRC